MPNTSLGRPFPWRIFYRILALQCFIVLAAVAGSILSSRIFFRHRLFTNSDGQTQRLFRAMEGTLSNEIPDDWCRKTGKDIGLDLFLLDLSGQVKCASSDKWVDGEREEWLKLRQQRNLGKNFISRLGDDSFYALYWPPHKNLILGIRLPIDRVAGTFGLFDATQIFIVMLTIFCLVLLALWSARQLVFPLGRMLVKAQSVLQPQGAILTNDDLRKEMSDEWGELESHIDDIRREFFARTQSLSREQVELETIMASISDAILAVDPEGTPMFYNSRFEVLFGGVGLRGKGLKVWGIFRDPEILQAFHSALEEGKAGTTKVIPLDQEGNIRRYLSLSVAPLRRQDGIIYGAVGIFHDVTELKSAEQMRIDFVANVSHELRTPLTVIKGFADTLIEDFKKVGGPTLDYLYSIARNSDRLMALMNDLLDLSSIESAGFIQKDTLNTEDLTQRVLQQLESQFEEKGQKVQAFYSAASVVADAHRAEQVLVNLLTNSHKYTPAGGHIVVEWENDGPDVLLKVKNDGPPIQLEHQARLFERFYRMDKARSRDQGGTGLGLAIVKHIMQRHGGTVWVESSPPQPGAAFVCRFPNHHDGDEWAQSHASN